MIFTKWSWSHFCRKSLLDFTLLQVLAWSYHNTRSSCSHNARSSRSHDMRSWCRHNTTSWCSHNTRSSCSHDMRSLCIHNVKSWCSHHNTTSSRVTTMLGWFQWNLPSSAPDIHSWGCSSRNQQTWTMTSTEHCWGRFQLNPSVHQSCWAVPITSGC